MQALREVVVPEGTTLALHVPENFANRKLEVLILPLEDDVPQPSGVFRPGDFRGILNMPERELIDEISRLREEWHRLS